MGIGDKIYGAIFGGADPEATAQPVVHRHKPTPPHPKELDFSPKLSQGDGPITPLEYFIASMEGYEKKVGPCPAGVPTVGFGQTAKDGGNIAHFVTVADAFTNLRKDVCHHYDLLANNKEYGEAFRKLPGNIQGALVSLSYNAGTFGSDMIYSIQTQDIGAIKFMVQQYSQMKPASMADYLHDCKNYLQKTYANAFTSLPEASQKELIRHSCDVAKFDPELEVAIRKHDTDGISKYIKDYNDTHMPLKAGYVVSRGLDKRRDFECSMIDNDKTLLTQVDAYYHLPSKLRVNDVCSAAEVKDILNQVHGGAPAQTQQDVVAKVDVKPEPVPVVAKQEVKPVTPEPPKQQVAKVEPPKVEKHVEVAKAKPQAPKHEEPKTLIADNPTTQSAFIATQKPVHKPEPHVAKAAEHVDKLAKNGVKLEPFQTTPDKDHQIANNDKPVISKEKARELWKQSMEQGSAPATNPPLVAQNNAGVQLTPFNMGR